MNGCKLVLTTRLLEVCRRVGCQVKIKLEPLSKDEAWTLFKEKLGHDVALSSEVKQVAKSVAEECAGLPLGIITIAGSMKGVDDICEWRNALEELKESKVRQDDMEPEVFYILRFSYMHLNDAELQQCFLYCALFPEHFEIKREDLINYLIVERIIKGKKSRQAEFDKGHTMLNKLENACLLESSRASKMERRVKMHDLIRDMAVQILRENSVMVEAGSRLKELPDVEEWRKDLVRVSLMKNDIEEIPPSHSPMCPSLSTLLLCSNYRLKSISNSFFKQLHGLEVLDLSHTSINKLPDSISELVNLTALLMKWCKCLTHIPSVAKLKALKKLDLNHTGLGHVPEDMEFLSNLKYLNLYGSRLEVLPCGILPKLSQLQVLILEEWPEDDDVYDNSFKHTEPSITFKGKEVSCLRKLETLECHFKHLSDFSEYLKSCEEAQSLSTYSFVIRKLSVHDPSNTSDISYYHPSELSKRVWLCDCSINRGQDFVALPKGIQELVMVSCYSPNYEMPHSRNLPSLSLFSPDVFEGLKSLQLNCLHLDVLFSGRGALPSDGTFSCLKIFVINDCNGMKELFFPTLLPNLQNLEVIRVSSCIRMVEIIATEEEEVIMGEESNCRSSNCSIEFSLPKLRRLELEFLPQLKSICNGVMICDALRRIVIVSCPSLKRIPLSLPLPSLKGIKVYPRQWWESVEWGQPNAKNLLQSFCVFKRF